MDTTRLVTMANDIAAFFTSAADDGAAAAKVAEHLKLYWAPRMRAAIVVHLQRGGEGLEDVARRAVTLLAEAAS